MITEQSKRLGMWMDWDRDYYTFTDTNIEYIWRFLAAVHERGWLYQGHRSTVWCPRCGTSISQHEVFSGEYRELDHPSLTVRLPLREREGESLAVWTTTPWTLPANVAAAVNPEAEYVLREDGVWVARERDPEARAVKTALGSELVGLEYEGPFDHLPAQEGVIHRVIPWEDVSLHEGTGIVHIAPGAGAEDFELSRVHGLPVLAPLDESGRMLPGFGFDGLSTDDVEQPIIEDLERRGLLLESGRIVHRYPTCWRCGTPLVFRVVDDWFISAEEIRQPMLDANATVEWTPAFYSKRMDDWLRNMGDWNISRKRYFGLPLPFYPCESCGELTVIGSRKELEERALGGLDGLRELHRPWIDEVTIACTCGAEVRRVPEVGDAWLDAGIVPLATLGWQSPEFVPEGYATGAGRGLTKADLPDHAYWEQWFPADWISEMREQIRLWFYSISFMSVTLTGQTPYKRVLTYEKLLDETGREMHRSWGNAIEVDEALSRMGADIMRWQYTSQPPSQNLLFGYGPAQRDPPAAAHALELGEVLRRLREHRWLDADVVDLEGRPGRRSPAARSLARLAHERARTRGDRGLRELPDRQRRPRLRGVRRGRVQLVHPPLATAVLGRGRGRVRVALVRARAGPARRRAGHAVPRRPSLARADRACGGSARVGAPGRLAGGRRAGRRCSSTRSPSSGAWSSSAARPAPPRASSSASRSGRSSSKALARAASHGAEIAEELRVKDVTFGDVEASELRVKPNLPVLGPKLGAELATVRAALEAGEFEELRRRQLPRRRPRARRRRGARRTPRKGRLGRRRVRRRHRGARPRARRGARARRARLRAHPHREHDAQGGGARADGSHRADAAARRTRTCSSIPTGSRARRSPWRSSADGAELAIERSATEGLS